MKTPGTLYFYTWCYVNFKVAYKPHRFYNGFIIQTGLDKPVRFDSIGLT